ncbi:MAG: hypothetical protein ACRCYO_18770 [Bacteroidia bacterium]
MKNYTKPYPKEAPLGLLVGDDFYVKNPHLRINYSFEEDRKISIAQLSLEDLLHYLFQIFSIDDPEPTYFELSLGEYVGMKDGFAVFNSYNSNVKNIYLKGDKSVSSFFSRIKSLKLLGVDAVEISNYSKYADMVTTETNKTNLIVKSSDFAYLKNVIFMYNEIEFHFERSSDDKIKILKDYDFFASNYNV